MTAPASNPLPLLAVQNIEVLQALAGEARFESAAQFAEAVGRDKSNLHKTLRKLTDEGLCLWPEGAPVPSLSAAGVAAVEAWARAVAPAEAGGQGIAYIPFDRIQAWALNPRTQFDPAAIEDMAKSIADVGVLQPITVRRTQARVMRGLNEPRVDDSVLGDWLYEVVIGERRRRGAALAVERGWLDDDFLIPCQIRSWSDDEALDVAGVENLQRHDLHWMDEARFYLRLAERGRSGAEIARLAGESVSKRKVQDYVKIARELSGEDQARCYLPEDHPNRLVYVRARELVGEKKERPALELSPKQALTLIEIIDAGVDQGGGKVALTPGATVTTRFHAPPAGAGPLYTLQHDKKLIDFGFNGERQVVAKVKITDDLSRWLKQVGYFEGAWKAVRTLRAAVLGDLEAARYEREAKRWVAELNPPDPPPQGEVAAQQPEGGSTQTPAAEPPSVASGDTSPDGEDRATPTGGFEPADEPEIPDYLRRLAGAGDPAPAPAPAPAPKSAPDTPPALPPMLANVVIELAHRIATAGVQHATGARGAVAQGEWHRDPHLSTLIQTHAFAKLLPLGDRMLVCLTPKAWDWLWSAHGVRVEDWRPDLGQSDLEHTQRTLMGGLPSGGRTYFTSWLEPAPEAPPPKGEVAAQQPEGGSAQTPAAEPEPAATPPTSRADLERALGAAVGALKLARSLLNTLTLKSKPASKDDVRPTVRVIDAALDAAKAAGAEVDA